MPRILTPMEQTIDLAQPGVQYGPIRPNPPLYDSTSQLNHFQGQRPMTQLTRWQLPQLPRRHLQLLSLI